MLNNLDTCEVNCMCLSACKPRNSLQSKLLLSSWVLRGSDNNCLCNYTTWVILCTLKTHVRSKICISLWYTRTSMWVFKKKIARGSFLSLPLYEGFILHLNLVKYSAKYSAYSSSFLYYCSRYKRRANCILWPVKLFFLRLWFEEC